MFRVAVRVLILTLSVPGLLRTAAAEPPRTPAFDYIVWDGHRFGRTPEQHERDFRWYKDLGFTHSLLGNAGVGGRFNADRTATMLALAETYDLDVGLRYAFIRGEADFLKAIGLTKQQAIDQGILLSKKPRGKHPNYSPVSPKVIQFYTDGFTRTLQEYLTHDKGQRLKLFLIGTEMGWPLPKTAEAAYAPALQTVFAAARADGVLKAGESPTDLKALGSWWSGSYAHGGDWRLRKAIEDRFLQQIPDASFWVDPIWAVKIVHGFGGTWTYIRTDPKNTAVAVKRLQAVTRPAAACHSTQLIRGAYHDSVVEANLLAICMGADKLYHWGVHTIEPGQEATPYYRVKTGRSPKGFPRFQASHIANWPALARSLAGKGRSKAAARLVGRLPAAARRTLEQTADMAALGADPGAKLDKDAIVAGLNDVLGQAALYDKAAFAGVNLPKRIDVLLARGEAGDLPADDRAELNRLLIESAAGEGIKPTPTPNIRELLERIRHKREQKEPALRTTGRLLRDRGELFAAWKPMHPRLAVLGGIYGGNLLNLSLIVGHVPFDILRSQKDREELLGTGRFAAVPDTDVSPADYARLLALTQRGGTVFVPEGFTPPAGQPALGRTARWTPPADAKGKRSPAEYRTYLHGLARRLRGELAAGGFAPYFDSENLDVVLGSYEYKGQPVVMVVNDLRRPAGAPGTVENVGVDNSVEIVIRDATPGLRAVNIDTGKEMPLVRRGEGYVLSDTVPGAWYRLYAVLKPSQTWDGPGPLKPAPALKTLAAAAKPDGVQLTWTLPFDDWVGCDVAGYRVHRDDGGGIRLLADIPGRILSGPGGVVTSYLDATAAPGRQYTYQVQAVSPVRTLGPLSPPATARR